MQDVNNGGVCACKIEREREAGGRKGVYGVSVLSA